MSDNCILVPDEIWEMNLKPKVVMTYVFYLGIQQGFDLDQKYFLSDYIKKRCTVKLKELGMIDDSCIPIDPKRWKRPQKVSE